MIQPVARRIHGLPGPSARQQAAIDQVELWGAHNYAPLPVVVAHAAGAVVHDIDGNAYLDCLAAYSAVNFGHGHPALVAAASEQLHKLTSRPAPSTPSRTVRSSRRWDASAARASSCR